MIELISLWCVMLLIDSNFLIASSTLLSPFGLIDKYDVLVEINQGEVICPLL